MAQTTSRFVQRVQQSLLAEQLARLTDNELLQRFIETNEQVAFAVLLHRHGPLVRGVCFRIVHDNHLAEDVFQATFLVLARKARSLRKRHLLANWLYGVATRLSQKALREHLRQQEKIYQSSLMRSEESQGTSFWNDSVRILDEELNKLPTRYRLPLLCCYLQGHTQDEAAQELGWSLSTLRRRLEQGKELLRVRMVARGATLSISLFASILVPATLSAQLQRTTLETSMAYLKTGVVPTSLASLVNGGSSMFGFYALSSTILAVVLASGLIITRPFWFVAENDPQQSTQETTKTLSIRKEPKRDQFHDPLPDGAIARMGSNAFRHRGKVEHLQYSLDGKSLFSMGDSFICQWSVGNGEEKSYLSAGKRTYWDVDLLSADGKRFFRIIHDPRGKVRVGDGLSGFSIQISDMENKNQITQLEIASNNGKQSGNRLRFYLAPDGQTLAIADIGEIWFWNLNTGAEGGHIRDEALNPWTAVFSSDSRFFITADPQAIHVWNIKQGGQVHALKGNEEQVAQLVVSPDGKWLASCGGFTKSQGNTHWFEAASVARIWDLKEGKFHGTVEVEKSKIERLAFAGNDTLISSWDAYPNMQSELVSWNVADRKEIQQWTMNRGQTLATSPDGNLVSVGGYEGIIDVWDLKNHKRLGIQETHNKMINLLGFSVDDQTIYSGASGEFAQWETKTGKLLKMNRSIGFGTGETVVSANNKTVAFCPYGGKDIKQTLEIWDLAIQKRVNKIEQHDDFTQLISLSSDGKYVAASKWVEKYRGIRVWETSTGKVVYERQMADDWIPNDLVFHPNGKLLYVTGKPIFGIDLEHGKELFQWDWIRKGILPKDANPNVRVVCSPDGKYLAFGVQNHGIVVADAKTGDVIRRMETPEETPWPLAFSPDSKRIISSNAFTGSDIRVWDVASGEKQRDLIGHRTRVLELAFSQSGQYLASGAYDGTILIWDLGTR